MIKLKCNCRKKCIFIILNLQQTSGHFVSPSPYKVTEIITKISVPINAAVDKYIFKLNAKLNYNCNKYTDNNNNTGNFKEGRKIQLDVTQIKFWLDLVDSFSEILIFELYILKTFIGYPRCTESISALPTSKIWPNIRFKNKILFRLGWERLWTVMKTNIRLELFFLSKRILFYFAVWGFILREFVFTRARIFSVPH